jgi:hypothetical protein
MKIANLNGATNGINLTTPTFLFLGDNDQGLIDIMTLEELCDCL